MICHANYSKKGQIKIQQMAFVLVAIMIFFAIAVLIYFSFRINSLKSDAQLLKEEESKEIVRKLSGMPEFSFEGCANCIDLDKALMLKERKSYIGFWDLKLLQIERVYPIKEVKECTRANYPDCNTITFIENKNYGRGNDAFVSLCRWEQEKGGYVKCELGRIYAAGGGIDE